MDYAVDFTRSVGSIGFDGLSTLSKEMDLIYKLFSSCMDSNEKRCLLLKGAQKCALYINAAVSAKNITQSNNSWKSFTGNWSGSRERQEFWEGVTGYLACMRGAVEFVHDSQITKQLSTELLLSLPVLNATCTAFKIRDTVSSLYACAQINANIATVARVYDEGALPKWSSTAQKVERFASAVGSSAFLGKVIADQFGFVPVGKVLGMVSLAAGALKFFSAKVDERNKANQEIKNQIAFLEEVEGSRWSKLIDKIPSAVREELEELKQGADQKLSSARDYQQLWRAIVSYCVLFDDLEESLGVLSPEEAEAKMH